jgi:hypothetical protein
VNVRRGLLWSVLLLVVLVSCSEERPSRDAGPEATASVPVEAAFVNGGDCPPARDPSLPAGTGCVSVVTKDNFEVAVYASLDPMDRPGSWHVRLTGPDEEIVERLDAGADYPRAVGASDVDLDGRFEWWVQLGDYASHGAPWAYVNLFFHEDGELVPLTFEDKRRAINYGGISRLGEGAECRDGDLVILRAEAKDIQNSRWRVIETTFSIEGHKATAVERNEDTVVVDNYVDPKIRRYFRIDCYGDSFLPFF